jgi:uncharacterized protein (DUF488 family)
VRGGQRDGARGGAYGVVIFTIGHSNHPIGHFLGLLREQGIATVADVRSTPASRFNPQYNRKALEKSLADAGIAYEFLGAELGARTQDPTCYENGRVSYRRLAATDTFQRGLERLMTIGREQRVAMMCAEYEPLDCHRTILVGHELGRHGVRTTHILRDGTLETDDAANARLVERLKLNTDDLFGGQDLVERAYEVQAARVAWARRDATSRSK